MSTIIPREGLYIDPIASIAKKTIFHPAWSVLLVAYFLLNPNRQWLYPEKLAFWTALFGLVLWGNEYLSHRSRNNWVSDATWDWRKEIVVVTGASGGIGGSVVQQLAADNVRVAAVDVAPLTYDIGLAHYFYPTLSTGRLAHDPGNKPISYYRCDLSDETEIRNLCARIREEVGHPTVLGRLAIFNHLSDRC